MIQYLSRKMSKLLQSPKFFHAIWILLVFQAAWIACTARYPQAFDENYHYGLIQLHASQWLPFFTSQPSNASAYGSVVRDPSYLFQYLLSFPYRMTQLFTSSLAVNVIALRFVDIGLFVSGLWAYRAVLRRLGVSQTRSNLVLLVFVLLPVVPLLAGQINYDNMMFPLTGLLFLDLLSLRQGLAQKSLSSPILFRFVAVGAAGSLVTFPFAPLFAGAIIYLAWLLYSHKAFSLLRPRFLFGLGSRLSTWLWTVVAAVLLGLCLERYGLNIVQYHNPVPSCDDVLSVQECLSYAPWARDYQFAATYPRPTTWGIAVYPFVWVHRMVYETMFSITSYIYEPTATVTYTPALPLPIANATAWILFAGACVGLIFAIRKLRDYPGYLGLLTICAFYSCILLLQNFQSYLHTGEVVAVHGRYFVCIYPLLLLAGLLGFEKLLQVIRLYRYRQLLALVMILLFIQGGGFTVWILRSDASWYWQQSPAAAQANWWAQDILKRLIVR